MPAGLDGATDRVESSVRAGVIDELAASVLHGRPTGRPLLVAVDGASGSGKSTLADEVGESLARSGVSVIRSTVDSFHRPRTERLARGRWSPAGYYLDSHQLDALTTLLLDPARRGAPIVTEVFDEPSDQPLPQVRRDLTGDEVLLVDGIFTLRPELRDYWDVSIFVTADGRVADRQAAWLAADLPADPTECQAALAARLPVVLRYAGGWQWYVDTESPSERADLVIDNDDLSAPRRL